ncbi:MAG: alpha-amylase, partial [Bacteroides sp.]|nr:alpha-amylase [Bacteroides sp.]
LTDDQIRTGWVFLTARQNGVPLFFSRPNGSTRQAYWGDNVLGARGNDEFFHPEVVAVNKFRTAMAGQKEDIQMSPDGKVLVVNRGKKGAAIVNIAGIANSVKVPTGLPDGTYKDEVYGKEFKVKKGILSGIVAPNKTYILQK